MENPHIGKNNFRRNFRILNLATDSSIRVEERSNTRQELIDNHIFSHYDSMIENYEKDFKDLLVPFETFYDFLKDTYGNRCGNLIGMELGGPGVNFFEGIPAGVFKQTVGVTLKRLPEHEVLLGRHEVLAADVFLEMQIKFLGIGS